jgi:cbb3-type cytochrome oxidase maturation protein
MTILYLLLPLMLAVAGGAVLAFVWAARRGQLDDLETPPLRMLVDDDAPVYGSRRRSDDP